ncbi:MAG: acyltransferase family protein, partial [Acidimicrobiia bacterium]
ITSLLLEESPATGRIGIGSFWARRARRLLPAVVGVLVGGAVYCAVFASPAELAQIRGDALGTLGYVANWRAVFASNDYFALFQRASPLQHTWSLAIEEQFYVVWPLVFVTLSACWKRAAPKAVLVVALGGAALSSVVMFVLYDPANFSRAYYGTDTRATGILLGAGLATALSIWGPVRGRAARVLLGISGVAGVAVLALAWITLDGQDPALYRGGFTLCAAAAVAVIATVTHPQAGFLSRVLAWRPLCVLGLISYGV